MLYVKALADDIWPSAPLQPIAEVVVEKTLVWRASFSVPGSTLPGR
jgi:hypothetical protein